MMNPDRRRRLFSAIEHSYRALEKFRVLNKKLIEQYAGQHYTEEKTASTRRFLNLVFQAVEAYSTMLVGSNPQCGMTATHPDLKPFAAHYNVAVNNLMDEIDIGDKFQQWIRNSFFGMGIGKVHMGESGQVIAEGDIEMDPGKPYFSIISLDNWVHDTEADTWGETKFQGDMYQMTLESLQMGAEQGRYDREEVKNLKPSMRHYDGERVDEIGAKQDGYDTGFEQMVDLIDVYIASERKIYTYAVSQKRECRPVGKELTVIPWEGDEMGPYHKIGFAPVPSNIMHIPLAANWTDLDTTINGLIRKVIQQARRSKTVIGYEPDGADDATRLKTAPDGELVQMMNLESVQEFKLGQIDGAVFAFASQLLTLFDRQAGNLQALLGLGASSDTVGQDKLIHGALSKTEKSMGAVVVTAATKVIKELARLLWYDDFKVIKGTRAVDGFPNLVADSTWKPGDREGVFSDYQVQCDVFSLRSSSPGERLQMIEHALQMIMPLMPLIQAQGGNVDVAELTNIFAELLNIPRLKDVVKFDMPVTGETGVRNDTPTKPPVSTRNYTRRNISGDNGQLDPTAVSAAQSA